MLELSRNIVGEVLLAYIILVLSATWAINEDSKRVQAHADQATQFGKSKLMEECLKERLKAERCATIRVYTDITDCDARTCWIVDGYTDDKQFYSGGVTVAIRNNKYVVLDYTRSTIIPN